LMTTIDSNEEVEMPATAATRSAGRFHPPNRVSYSDLVAQSVMAANFTVRRHSSRDHCRDGADVDLQIQCRTEGTTGTLWAQGDVAFGLTPTTSIRYSCSPRAPHWPPQRWIRPFSRPGKSRSPVERRALSNTVTGTILELRSID
jgi:hypothetical protein